MNNSRVVAYALGVIMAGVLLPACSSGSGAGTSTIPVASQGVNGFNTRGGAEPAEKLCKPVVYTGVGWQYEPYYNQYWEYTGPWTYGANNVLVPCAGDLVIAKTSAIGFPWWGTIRSAVAWSNVKRASPSRKRTRMALRSLHPRRRPQSYSRPSILRRMRSPASP